VIYRSNEADPRDPGVAIGYQPKPSELLRDLLCSLVIVALIAIVLPWVFGAMNYASRSFGHWFESYANWAYRLAGGM
jgi:hypothetical protein